MSDNKQIQTTEAQTLKTIESTEWTTPKSAAHAYKMAEAIANSDLAPKDFKGKPQNCLMAIQMGAEVGINPMQSIQSIAVINGRPCLWGDAMLALIMGHKDFSGIEETQTGDSATCTVHRHIKGKEFTFTQTFSKADAKTANLLDKQGPWKQYPRRMLQMRARGFALRDAFADALRGINLAEEVRDYNIKDITQTQSVSKKESDLAAKLGIEIKQTQPTEEKESVKIDAAITEKAALLDKLIDDNELQPLRNKWLDSKKVGCFEEFSEPALDYCINQIKTKLEKKQTEAELADDFYAEWDAAGEEERK